MDRKPTQAYLAFVHAVAGDLAHPRTRLVDGKGGSKGGGNGGKGKAKPTLTCVRGTTAKKRTRQDN